MNPLFTLAAGIVVGVLGVRSGRRAASGRSTAGKTVPSDRSVRAEVVNAGDELRRTAVSGLSALEKGSKNLRQRLHDDEPSEPAPSAPPTKARKRTRKASNISSGGQGKDKS